MSLSTDWDLTDAWFPPPPLHLLRACPDFSTLLDPSAQWCWVKASHPIIWIDSDSAVEVTTEPQLLKSFIVSSIKEENNVLINSSSSILLAGSSYTASCWLDRDDIGGLWVTTLKGWFGIFKSSSDVKMMRTDQFAYKYEREWGSSQNVMPGKSTHLDTSDIWGSSTKGEKSTTCLNILQL